MNRQKINIVLNTFSAFAVLFTSLKSLVTYVSLPALIPVQFDILMRPASFGDKEKYLFIIFLPIVVWSLTFISIDKSKKNQESFKRSVIRAVAVAIVCIYAFIYTAATRRYL